MLSKEQANRIAQDLLDQAEAARIKRRSAAVSPIGWYWSCPELNLLAPHQRSDIVEQAKADVRTHPFLILYCFIGFGVFFGWWLGRSPVHQSQPVWLPVLGFSALVLYLLVRAFLVRREVRMLAAEMLPSWSASHAHGVPMKR